MTGSSTSRPASAAPKSAAPAASKAPTAASKTTPSAAKTSASTAKPSPAKTPSAARAPSASTKSPTPVKKDASKTATPAAKKSTASPLTRPPSTKTSKPDGVKATTPAKSESVSKKPSTPSKPAGDAKTSKPKESKPTPSKEIGAAAKASSAKNSTAKTASPKKVVGSSTPMPVKRAPKATQKEREGVAPAVENTAAVEVVAVAAAAAVAATAAGTFIAVTESTSEVLPEPKLEAAPEPNLKAAPEPKLEAAPESKLEAAPESKLEAAPGPNLEAAPEPNLEAAPEPKLEAAPGPNLEAAPGPNLEAAPGPNLEAAPEPKLEAAPGPILDDASETQPQLVYETKSENIPEAMSELLPEIKYDLEPEPKSNILLENESEFIPESKPTIVPEPKSELLIESEPERTAEDLVETTSEISPEPQSDGPLETESEFTSEIKTEFLLETNSEFPSATGPQSELLLDTESEFAPEQKSELLLETESEFAHKPKSEFPLEADSEFALDSKSEGPLNTEPEIALEPESEFPLEAESEYAIEAKSELQLEGGSELAESEIAPEPKSELPLEVESEIAPEPKTELLFETESQIAPEPKTELLFETESEIAPEPKTELQFETESEIAPEPKTELLFETESEIAPEPKTELLFETESEIAPEPKTELLFETESEIAPEPKTELLFKTESEIAPEPETERDSLPATVPEPTVESLIAAAVEDIAGDGENIPSDTDEETPEEVVPQLAAQLNVVHFEHPSAPSTLGTTVMSPPSSPTGESPVHVEPQLLAPSQNEYAASNIWAHNQPMFSSDITTENLEQEEIRVQEDLLTTMESAEEEAVDVGKPFSLGMQADLLSRSHMEHFGSMSPTSPGMEKEEAVEKAEEEINEDDHEEEENDDDEDEEEEQEQQDREIVKVQAVPEKEDDYGFGLSEFSSSSHGVMQSEDFIQQQQVETTPCFQMEGQNSDEDEDDFSLKKVETEQPFMGPPGVKSFSDEDEEEEEQEKEDMDTGPEHIEKGHMDFGHEQAGDHHMDVHLKSEEEEEHEDDDVEMVSEGLVESGSKTDGNVEEDDYEEGYVDNLNCTAPAPSIPMTAAWGPSNPFADTWGQPTSINILSTPLEIKAADAESPTKSPAEAWLEKPLGHLAEPHLEVHEATESSVPVDSANLCAPPIGMSQSSTLSGTALAAHSSSETSTPEELRDYDSSSGVESRSDKQQTPVPTVQPDQEQDLGIHLERGDGEEEEAETLPADEILGDAPTAPASVPSSPSTSGDEASDTEGEMQINDPDAPADDTAALDSPTASRNLPALEEDEEATDMHAGEEDGGTPQSANSVASYGFDCSVSNSNAHSTAESCGKSPGIFSLENEDQLPEEAKDPSLIKELTSPPAAAQAKDLLGCPVDLLPLSQQGESHTNPDEQYLLCGKTGASALEESDPESPMHLSPPHGDGTDGQQPYYSTICDNTDSFLAGYSSPQLASHQEMKYGNLPLLPPEVNGNHDLTPMQNAYRHHKPLLPHQQQQQPARWVVELGRLSAACVPQARRAGQLRRLEQHQLHLRHILQRQEQERQERLWLEAERQRRQLQKQLERQQTLRQLQKQERRRMERQKQLERQWQELLQQLLRQKHRQQWQVEREQRLKRQQRVQPLKWISPSRGLCTIYEAMETNEVENIEKGNDSLKKESGVGQEKPTKLSLRPATGNLHQAPQCEHDGNAKVDEAQKLINQALLLEGEDGSPPLLYLPGQGGGTLNPLESSSWPQVLHQLSHASATITSVCSYSPTRGNSPQGDWTIVELETYH